MMKHILKATTSPTMRQKSRFLTGAVILLLGTLQSCIFEDMEPCVQYDLTLKIVGSNGLQLPSETVDSISLFLFDTNGYVRMVSAGRSNDFTIGYPKEEALTLIAWGNLKKDSLLVPLLSRGQQPEEVMVTLRQLEAFSMNPTDLFYARYTVTLGQEEVLVDRAAPLSDESETRALRAAKARVDTLPLSLERIVASLTITGQYMDRRFGTDTAGYHFVVYSPRDALNFMGTLAGDTARYAPATTMNTAGQLITPAIRVLPTPVDGALTVALFRGDSLLYTTSLDSRGEPLRAVAGKQLDILLDFRYSYVKVSVDVVPWGEVRQNTEL